MTLFGTAEIYGGGRSEWILGEALADDRESTFLATKVWPVAPSASLVRRRASASCGRLQAPHLDLYQVHWENPLFPDGPFMRGMRSLLRSGVIDEVGVSGYSLDRWRASDEALGGRVLSNQVGYSLIDRRPEQDVIPFAASHGRAIIAFSPLAKGLLSGKYLRGHTPTGSARTADPLFHPDMLARVRGLLSTLQEVAEAHSAAEAQVALAWVIHSPAVVAIPGASSVEQLESNVAAAEIALSDGEYQALNEASASFTSVEVAGRSGHPILSAMKHWVKGGALVAQTIWNDHAASRS